MSGHCTTQSRCFCPRPMRVEEAIQSGPCVTLGLMTESISPQDCYSDSKLTERGQRKVDVITHIGRMVSKENFFHAALIRLSFPRT